MKRETLPVLLTVVVSGARVFLTKGSSQIFAGQMNEWVRELQIAHMQSELGFLE